MSGAEFGKAIGLDITNCLHVDRQAAKRLHVEVSNIATADHCTSERIPRWVMLPHFFSPEWFEFARKEFSCLEPDTASPTHLHVRGSLFTRYLSASDERTSAEVFSELSIRAEYRRERRIPTGTQEKYGQGILSVCDGCHQPCLFVCIGLIDSANALFFPRFVLADVTWYFLPCNFPGVAPPPAHY